MKNKLIILFVFLLSCIALTGQNIFISTGSGTLYKTNPSTCVSTLIGSCPTFVDIAFLPNGRLYGQTWGAIYEVDTLTAATTLIMNLGSGNSLVGGSNGMLYAVSGTTLREIDPSVPSATILGNVNCGSGGDLAFFNDTLYLACSGNNLLKIDISNPGASFSVGNMSISGAAWGLVNASSGCVDNPFVISSSGNMYPLNYSNATVGAVCNIGIVGSVYGAASPNEFGGGSNNFLGLDTALCNQPNYILTAPAGTDLTYLWNDSTTADTLNVTSSGTYYCDVTDTVSGCILTDTVTVNFVSTNFNDTIIDICVAGVIDLNDYVTTPTGSNWLNSSNIQINFPQALNNIGTYNYSYTVPSPCNDTINVTVNILHDSLNIGNDTIFCNGGSADFRSSVAGLTYNWSTGAVTDNIAVNTSGIYFLDATDFVSGCILSDTVEVLVLPVPDAGADGNVTHCSFIGLDLFNWIQGTPILGGNWYDPNGLPINMPFNIESPIDGNYMYVVTNGVCYDTSFVRLTNIIPDLSGFDYYPQRIIVEQTEVTFDAISNGDAIRWFIDNTPLTNDPSISMIFDDSKVYQACLIVTTDNCIDTICENIEVLEDVNLYTPSSFTPDGDGLNDVFTPIVLGIIEDYNFYIFDRWGQQIFFSDIQNESWNGKVDNQLLKNDTYIWRITFKIPGVADKKEFIGHVTLIK